MGGIKEAQKRFTLCTGGGAALKYLATQNLSALDGLDER
jgi:3-phosphoglycerate kinase